MVSDLRKDYPDNVIPVSFNENIDIEYEKDANGNFVKDKSGNYAFKQASVVDWSIQCLKDIFYSKKIQMYEDVKFDTQINNVIVGTTKQGKHLSKQQTTCSSFQVFGICLERLKNKPIRKKSQYGVVWRVY